MRRSDAGIEVQEAGAPPAESVEELGNFQPIDFVDGDIAHRLQQTLRPDGTSQSVNAALTAIERELEPIGQPRRPFGQNSGALDDHAPRRNVDDPAFVGKPSMC